MKILWFLRLLLLLLIPGSFLLCKEISVPINKNFSSEIIFPTTLNFSRVLVDLKKKNKKK